MAPRYGVDTSVLVRLVTREPPGDFERCVSGLGALVEDVGCEIFASNQAIAEAYPKFNGRFQSLLFFNGLQGIFFACGTTFRFFVTPLRHQTTIFLTPPGAGSMPRAW